MYQAEKSSGNKSEKSIANSPKMDDDCKCVLETN